MKFKIGDKIRRTKLNGNYPYMKVGNIYTVEEIEDDRISIKGIAKPISNAKKCFWDISYFELAEKQFEFCFEGERNA